MFDFRKRKTVISILRGRKFVVLLCLVSPITANSTEERKRKEWGERGRILVPRLRRGQRIVEQSRGSPRHPLLPSEFSIVPRVVPLAIFAAWHLVRSAFLSISPSLLVLIGSPLPRRIFEERKRWNSAGNGRPRTPRSVKPRVWSPRERETQFIRFFLSFSLPPR